MAGLPTFHRLNIHGTFRLTDKLESNEVGWQRRCWCRSRSTEAGSTSGGGRRRGGGSLPSWPPWAGGRGRGRRASTWPRWETAPTLGPGLSLRLRWEMRIIWKNVKTQNGKYSLSDAYSQALTEDECERRVQGQYGVSLLFVCCWFYQNCSTNITFSSLPSNSLTVWGRRLQITNLSFQVEYKKDEESFLLFEVQMLHLATVVRKSTMTYHKVDFRAVEKPIVVVIFRAKSILSATCCWTVKSPIFVSSVSGPPLVPLHLNVNIVLRSHFQQKSVTHSRTTKSLFHRILFSRVISGLHSSKTPSCPKLKHNMWSMQIYYETLLRRIWPMGQVATSVSRVSKCCCFRFKSIHWNPTLK